MKAQRLLAALLRWGGRVLLVGLCLFLGLIAYLLIQESITRSKYRAEYPPPGQMVSLETHDIHLYCVGSGSPTVVFESDLDQYGSLSWDSVQDEVGEFTRACSYDRAGIMWSEPGPLPRDGETIASELKAVLDAAGESGPYVLVGHAFGGAYVRIFAGQNPDDVCGMVLVESSHPEMLTRFEEYGVTSEIPDRNTRPLILLLSRLGMPGRYKGNVYNLPPDVYDPVQAFLPESSMTWFDEKVEAPNTLAQAGQVKYLGDLPLIVIAATKPPTSIERGQILDDLWLELQHELLSLSENSEIRIYKVGHYPQFQSPELVIQAIRDIVERCRE
ncbi:MAG: alpha/beta hydrolase [Chloroflexi bacterium]|nr:alpha/beta hydrolase [Chloroflexota bacterium]MBU1747292.1 alpha/beta hydrolase [Chloroflexota bacterium]MBU1877523.1 alpha/beta hydrolase [Chloroflexota bacterium]